MNAGDSAFKSPFVGSSKIFRYLHCGDFRASPQHVLHPAVKGKHLHHVYLDTTYLDHKVRIDPCLLRSVLIEMTMRSIVSLPNPKSFRLVLSSRSASSLVLR